jgi:CBS domain-containing protein
MNLLTLADVPPIEVQASDSVWKAVDAAVAARVGAVAVLDNGRLVGIFTERDLMKKVVHPKLDLDKTPMRDVMSSPVWTVPATMHVQDALRLMLERHTRHLIISSDGNKAQGVLSIRNVMQYMLDYLQKNLRQMESYLGR